MKNIKELFKKKEDENETQEGDLIDEVVDDVSYFYKDPKPEKPDKWYSRVLNLRNVLIALGIFVVGVTSIGAYVNSIYFTNGKEKTYLTEEVKNDIYFWDTTDKALDFANEAQVTFKRAFDSLVQNSSSPLTYSLNSSDIARLDNLYKKANDNFLALTSISYYPSVSEEYKGDYDEDSQNLNPLSPWYYIDRLKEFYSNSDGNKTISWINPLYLAFCGDSTIDQIDYDLIKDKLSTYSTKINDLISYQKTSKCTSGYIYANQDYCN